LHGWKVSAMLYQIYPIILAAVALSGPALAHPAALRTNTVDVDAACAARSAAVIAQKQGVRAAPITVNEEGVRAAPVTLNEEGIRAASATPKLAESCSPAG